MRIPVCVLGGMNMDITGTPAAPLLPGDSNPGSVRMSAGGVGRNIAENLARLGFSVELMAPVGNDGFASILQQDCAEAGIGLRYAFRLEGASSIYFCLMDGRGDMAAAINDMSLCDALTPQMLDMPAINSFAGAALDANLPEPVLKKLGQEAAIPLIGDPVSVAKARRFLSLLPRLAAIKPNRLEAAVLTGLEDPSLAARALVKMGVGQAFVSAGPEGLFFCGQGKEGHLPAPALRPRNATGAGDSATAAIVAGLLLGKPIQETARLACRISACTLRCPGAVNPDLSPSLLD